MLWFGLRKRLGYLRRLIRDLNERLTEVERLKGTLASSVASVENATDKLNRVVERRRKQMALEEGYTYDDGSDDDDYEYPEGWDAEAEAAFQEAIAKRQGPPQLTNGAEEHNNA